MQAFDKIVPDTSTIIEGVVSKKIISGEISAKEILIHEAVLAELEAQANSNREIGYLGLDEVKKLRELSEKYNFEMKYLGNRPGEFDIKHAKTGEIDSLIRNLAYNEKAVLITADKVQALVAESKGIKVMLIEFEVVKKILAFEKYFDERTMSIHLKENCTPKAKKGMPGNWDFIEINKEKFERDVLKEMAKEIVEEAGMRSDGFIEIERKGSTIVQLSNYRIVITKPPLADGYEITIVKPVKKLNISEYNMSEKLKERISRHAEGILISGSPGHGKSTFAQALAEFYLKQNKIVKTIEAPRDLVVSDEVTQYAMSHGTPEEIHDIMLLSRPDYSIFDEMRNTNDFRLFSDLRLSGVGMIGVVHATNPIDAIQRFIGRIELGVIPHVIDTVIFIKDGKINRVFSVAMDVKVPSGMMEADLARPVVVVNDFESGKLEFEIYSYGEETVVIPVKAQEHNPALSLASKAVEEEFRNYSDTVRVDMVSNDKAVVYVPERYKAMIIGRGGSNIEEIEKRLGLSIDVREISEKKNERTKNINYQVKIDKKNITFLLNVDAADKDTDIYVDGDYLLTAKSSKNSVIKLNKGSKMGKITMNAVNAEEKIELKQ